MISPYTFLGLTQSLCPVCRALVPAKIVVRDRRVYFRKRCPQHGSVEDFVCSDAAWYDRSEVSQPARRPRETYTEARLGCPFDCGLCPEHEQHTCVALAEITSSCNLTCPMCYAESAPGGTHWSFETFAAAVERFVRQEGGEADVLQISGGEPTIHPEFLRFVRHACDQPIQVVMINTNGVRFARDLRLLDDLADLRHRLEIYLQFDGFTDGTNLALRGEPLLSTKLKAIENLLARDLRVTLVCTVQHGVNTDQLGAIVKFGLDRRGIRGVSFQPATYSGRHTNPADLENRATIPDVVRGICAQTGGLLSEEDFLPLPCAHPNCHAATYLYRGGGVPVPLTRLVDLKNNLDLVANTLVYTPKRAREVVARIVERMGACCAPGG